jgi:ligand-binding SRPBCC domain-containing protein
MSKVHRLVSIQKLPLTLQETWKFFSSPHNLLTITPPFLNLRVTNELVGDEAYAGQIITYKVKPIAGIGVSWMTEITHLEKEKIFVDEQRKGPYKLWHHQHHFTSIKGGTEMRDIIHYRLPFCIIGELTHPLVKKKLLEIFLFRFETVIKLFGDWPDQKPNINVH